jgi:O-acetylserine/cysteine efflux transporter
MTLTHRTLALALAAIFGLGWVLGKTALDHFSPIFLSGLRFGCAALAMLPFLQWPAAPLRSLLLISALAISLPFSLSNYGLSKLDVTVTTLLVQMEAPILIVMSALFLKEIPARLVVFGVAIALVGVVFVAGKPAISGSLFPIIVVVASMVIWAGGQLLIRKLQIQASFSLLGVLALLATPQLFLLSYLFEVNHFTTLQTATLANWLQVVYLGLVMTVGGIGIWYFLISRYSLNLAAPYLFLVPVVSVTGGVAFLGETLAYGTLLGGALIVFGVATATLAKDVAAPSQSNQQGR